MWRGASALGAILALAVLLGAVAPVAGAPTPPPAAYHGPLTVNGEPAPAGVTVTAAIDGEVRGSITTSEPGRYGGAGAFDPKLQVDGTDADEGATVDFRVEGESAGTAVWRSSDVREVSLSATGVATPPDGGGPGGGVPGGGGLPPAEGPPDTTDSPGEPSVSVNRSESGVSVSVVGAQAGRAVVAQMPEADETGLDSISITPRTDGSFDLDVATSADTPADAPALPGGDGFGYLRIDHSVLDTPIDGVTFGFRVSKQQLADRGVDPADVALHRLDDGAWEPLTTRRTGETTESYTFESDSPRLSLFAIGQRTAADSPTESSNPEAPDEPASLGSGLAVGVVALVALAILAGGVLAARRR